MSNPILQGYGDGVASLSTGLLTSREEIERLYSTVGVTLRHEDGDSLIIDEIVLWASETVASYTLKHYNTSDLVASPWARRRATILAAYYLSQRRGNPPQFLPEAKRVLEDLELVRSDKIIIPGVPSRAASIPAISTYRIDDRYYHNKNRVVKSQSTSPYPGQPAYELPYVHDIF